MKRIVLLLLCAAMLLAVTSCSTPAGSTPSSPSAPPAASSQSGGETGSGSALLDMEEDPVYLQPVLDIGGYQISYGVYRHYYQLVAKSMMGQDSEYFTKNPEKLEELSKQTLEQCRITAAYFNLAAKAGIALPSEEEFNKSFEEFVNTYEPLYPLYYGVTMEEYMVQNAMTISSFKLFYAIDTYLTGPVYDYMADEKNGMVDLSDGALEAVLKDWRAVKHILVGYNDDLTDEQALALATELRGRILAGEDMETLMKQYSNDYQGEGRNVYTFTYGQMVEEFEKTAFSMEIGAVSEPVKSTYGYHVILRLEIDKESFKKKEFLEAAVNKAFFGFGAAQTVSELEGFSELTHETLMK